MQTSCGRGPGGRHVDECRPAEHGPSLRILPVSDRRSRPTVSLRSRHVLGPASARAQFHRQHRLPFAGQSVGGVQRSAVYRHGWRTASCLSNVDFYVGPTATRWTAHCRRQVRTVTCLTLKAAEG